MNIIQLKIEIAEKKCFPSLFEEVKCPQIGRVEENRPPLKLNFRY